jgi:hypothetical protein
VNDWICSVLTAKGLRTARATWRDGLLSLMGGLIELIGVKRYPFEEIKVCIVRKD